MSLEFENFENGYNYLTCPYAYNQGGINLNPEEDENNKKAVKIMAKEFGKKALTGQFGGFSNIPKPCLMCKPITLLETQGLEFINIPKYLNEACQASNSIEQFKLAITAVISGYYNNFSELGNKVPLDCELGETIEAYQEDGSHFYAECLSTQPPLVAYQIYGPNRTSSSYSYKLYGNGQITSSLSGINSVIGQKTKKSYIIFLKNGQEESRVCFTHPQILISGILYGQRIMQFTEKQEFSYYKKSLKNNEVIEEKYEAVVSYGKIEKKSMFGWFSDKKQDNIYQKQNDYVDIKIYDKQEKIQENNHIASGYGIWTSFIQFQDKLYWKYEREKDNK